MRNSSKRAADWGFLDSLARGTYGSLTFGRQADALRDAAIAEDHLTREDTDKCSYACEIALQHFHEQGRSLDTCTLRTGGSPRKFTVYVPTMVAEELSSFKIRWVALRIRKRAKDIRNAGHAINLIETLPRNRSLVSTLDSSMVPAHTGPLLA